MKPLTPIEEKTLHETLLFLFRELKWPAPEKINDRVSRAQIRKVRTLYTQNIEEESKSSPYPVRKVPRRQLDELLQRACDETITILSELLLLQRKLHALACAELIAMKQPERTALQDIVWRKTTGSKEFWDLRKPVLGSEPEPYKKLIAVICNEVFDNKEGIRDEVFAAVSLDKVREVIHRFIFHDSDPTEYTLNKKVKRGDEEYPSLRTAVREVVQRTLGIPRWAATRAEENALIDEEVLLWKQHIQTTYPTHRFGALRAAENPYIFEYYESELGPNPDIWDEHFMWVRLDGVATEWNRLGVARPSSKPITRTALSAQSAFDYYDSQLDPGSPNYNPSALKKSRLQIHCEVGVRLLAQRLQQNPLLDIQTLVDDYASLLEANGHMPKRDKTFHRFAGDYLEGYPQDPVYTATYPDTHPDAGSPIFPPPVPLTELSSIAFGERYTYDPPIAPFSPEKEDPRYPSERWTIVTPERARELEELKLRHPSKVKEI